MKAILQSLLHKQLEDIAGARIRGQVCLQDSLGNELLQALTQKSQTAPIKNEKKPAAEQDINPADLLPLVKIHTLRYETANNKTWLSLDLEISSK